MANNYMGFCEKIAALTRDEHQWFLNIPEGIEYRDDPKYEDDSWADDLKKACEEHGLDLKEIDEETLDMFPYFELDLEEKCCYVCCEESAYLDHVACVVQAFIRKFRPDYIFKLCWAEYCDRNRVGEFGGGWLVVSKDDVEFGNTYAAADETAEAMRTGSFKA